MKNVAINNRGFTLLEIVTSIVVASIIAVIAGMGFVEIVKGYMLSKKNATVAQQGQIAIARLKKEFTSIKSITCGSANMITYKSNRNPSEEVTIYWSDGNPIRLKMSSNCIDCNSPCADGDILADKVSVFELGYCTSPANCSTTFPNNPNYTPATLALVKVTLKLKGYEDATISIANPDLVILNQESGG
jgi:prepilin-type N-terminal cleavage/methylation domain-containing protein